MSDQPVNTEPQIKLSESDKETFFKCFLSETPYQEEYALFGGKFKVKFKTLSVEENEDVLKQIQLDNNKQVAESSESYFVSILLYRLGLSIVHINGEEFQPEVNKKDYQGEGTYVAAKADIFKAWPIFKLAGVQHTFRQFEQKVLALTNELENPSFWKAAV
jgi:hypothetical protein